MSSDAQQLAENLFKGAAEYNDQVAARYEKWQKLQEQGEDPFLEVKYEGTRAIAGILADFEVLEEQTVKVAGRLMSKRNMGTVGFADLTDSSGTIQLFARKDLLGADFAKWKALDIGDIIGLEGEVFKTKTGEISLRIKEFTLLAKCLRPLPEKFHGLQDQDTRYRQRYLDLITNPEIKEVFLKRSEIIKAIREFLDEQGFMEVETPILNLIPGGASARPFKTHHNTLDLDMYMRIAPELYLKQLIIGGFERVYELGRNFRNEGMSTRHNPEFTMIELYQAYTDYKGMMTLTENLINYCATKVLGTTEITWLGEEISLKTPFRRLSMQEAVLEYAGVDFSQVATDEEALKLAQEQGIEVEAGWKKGDIFNAFFEEFAEKHLIQPTFIYDYPIEVSPLTKKKPSNPELTERFELFINGHEFANAYSELNDPLDQRVRFLAQEAKREAGDDEANHFDESFVLALDYAMPPTGGMGMGIDRLVMLLTGADSIRDVLLFPTMKPLGAKDAGNEPASQVDEACEQVSSDLTEIDFSKVKVEPLFEDMIDFETFSKGDFRAVKVIDCEEVPKSKKLLKFTLDDGSDEERVILSGIKDYYQAEDLIGKTLLAICNLPARKMMGIDSEGMILSAVHEEDGEEKLNLIILSPKIPAGAKIY